MLAIPRLLGVCAVIALLVAPVNETAMLMLLGAAVNLAIATLLLRDLRRRQTVPALVGHDRADLYLQRRTLPQLRSRRPTGVVEEQVRWRHAAETHKRRRDVS